MFANIDFAAHPQTYTPTTEFNGKAANRRRQALTVVEGYRINHGPHFPNTRIVGRVILQGLRGATYSGFVHDDGRIQVLN